MAFKLTKAESTQRAELINKLAESRGELDAALDAFNLTLDEARDTLNGKIEQYNEHLAEAREFIEAIAARAEEEISEKSDKWQEGERGEAAGSWRDEWQNASMDEIEIDLPEDINLDADDHSDTLDGLPEEAE